MQLKVMFKVLWKEWERIIQKIFLSLIVGADPCVRPRDRNKTLYIIRVFVCWIKRSFIAIKSDCVINAVHVSQASVAGRQPFCRYATFPLTGEFHTGPPLQLLSYVSVIIQNVAKTAKPPPQSARADSFFWRKRQPFCHFVTFPLTREFPIAYAMGGAFE